MGSQSPGLPPFVTHAPDGAEERAMKMLYTQALRLGNEFTSAKAWIDNDLLPAGDEVNAQDKKGQSAKRVKAARRRRVARLNHHCKIQTRLVLGGGSATSPPLEQSVAHGVGNSFVNDDHSFGLLQSPAPPLQKRAASSTPSPQGVDALELATAIEAAPLPEMSPDLLESLLTKQTKQHTQIGEALDALGSSMTQSGLVSSHLSSKASSIESMMELEQVLPVLDELDKMEATANQLSASHFRGVVTTLRSAQPNNKIAPEAGSIMIHSTLPVLVFDKLRERATDLTAPTPFLIKLHELGVLAVGRVYARKRRVTFLPNAPEERRDDIESKLRKMMDKFADEDDKEDEAPGCIDLIVYFDTEEDVPLTVEALNAEFALVVLSHARDEGITLDDSLNQMLDDHERRQTKLQLAESTISSVYEFVAVSASRAGSSVAASSVLDPVTPPPGSRWPNYGGSDFASQFSPSIAPSELEPESREIPPPQKPTSNLTSSHGETGASSSGIDYDVMSIEDRRKQRQTAGVPAASDTPSSLRNPFAASPDSTKTNAVGSTTPPLAQPTRTAPRSTVDEDEVEEGFVRLGAHDVDRPKRSAQSIPRMTADSRPSGNVFEELTHPHAPSAQLLTELDGKRPAAQRSRLPAPSSAGALEEQLKRVGAEIDGEQPFEIFGEHIEEDVEEPILDKVLKERHEEYSRYEKWSGAARQRWVDYLLDERLLLNDSTITSIKECMSNGQKLEFMGSTDGCPYGVVALHVHGINDASSRKLVADQLVEWLHVHGETHMFYGTPLRAWVRWDRVPPNVSNWAELMAHLRDSFAFLEYTAADWLLFIANAHVFGPVLIFSARLSRAVRFVAADGLSSADPTEVEAANLGLRGYVDEAQLPAASETWLRVGLLENGHFARCRSKELKSELMLRMCDTRDVELNKQLSVEVPHAVIFQGPSKAGKSTIMNALARKVLYDSTPPAPKKGEKKGGRIEPQLSVLGAAVKGSEIGRDKESETLLVNSMVIRTDDDETPCLQLLDTPGMFDSRGPLIEVVNAVSIAKCMVRFKTLRIVVMVREAALDGTGEGFANTAEAMSKLFSMAGGSASAKRNVLLWINPHKPEVSYGDDGIIDEIKKMNAARPEIRDFLRTIVSQHNSRKVVHMLEYDPETAQGEEREAIVRTLQQLYPSINPEAPVTKAIFDIEGLLDQLVALQPMRNPAEKCGLPLTDKAVAEIARQASELHDYVSLRCELHDYASLLRYLNVLQALCKHMQAGSSALQGQNKFDTTYQASLATVAQHLKSTCSKAHIESLCLTFEQPIAFKATDLDSLSLAMRAAAAAAVLEPHLSLFLGSSSWSDLGLKACREVVCTQIQRASEGSRKLLSDHFINGSSGLEAAYRVFGEQVKLMLTKLQQIKEHLNFEASIHDGASASFAFAAKEADGQLILLYKALLQAVDTQTKAAADCITRGLNEASIMACEHLRSLKANNDEVPVESSAVYSANPFDAAASVLDVVKFAEGSLASLVDEIQGIYALSRAHTIAVVEKQSLALCTLIEQQRELAWTEGLMEEPLKQMLTSLLFLLHARSSSLRRCYDEPVIKLVEWHADLIKGVMDAFKQGGDLFVKNLSDFQQQTELAFELAQLAAVEKIQTSKRAVQQCAKWGILHTSANDVSRRIEMALNTFAMSVDLRLKEHTSTIVNAKLDVIEAYDYKRHAKDLIILKNAQWCDAILPSPITEAATHKVWQAFAQHMKQLAQGEDGAITLLRKGKHKDARTLLVQIHGMEVLFDASLINGNEAAQRVKEIHDDAEKVANDVVADKCEKARTKVLDRPGPLQARERWDWWMDIGVRDANFTDALWHLNSLLDLATWLVTASKGHNRLDGWLNLAELERMQIDCANRANDVIDRLQSRARSFFAAVGSCQSPAMDESALQLAGNQSQVAEPAPVVTDGASLDGSEDTVLEDSLDTKAAIKVACRELKEILQLLSRPCTYSAVFAAARDSSDPDSAPNNSFRDLETFFQSTYMECQVNFGDDETEPVARQKALYIYSEFDRSLPSDKAFEGFKKIFQNTYQHLVSAHQLAKKSELSALRGHFANFEFNETTYRMMVNLRNSAEGDPKARIAYEGGCSMLSSKVRLLLEYIKMSFTHLKHPEQSFRVQDHLVKPWNQLQDARSHTEFFNEVSGSTPIDLDAELAQMVQSFEVVFRDEVLQPFAKMFNLGEYTSAEGDNSFGLKRVHILTNQIQAQGGQLGAMAKAALDKERARQKTELENIHLLTFPMSFQLPETEEEAYLEERKASVDEYLNLSFSRIAQMLACKGDCDLITEYKAALDRIVKQVRAFLISEFNPLFQDDYLNLSKMHVNYLERLLYQMEIGGYVSEAAKHLNVNGCRQVIEMYRSLSEHQDKESFSVMEPAQQAEVIRRTSPQSKSYIGIVQEFSQAHKNAVQRTYTLLQANYAEVAPGALEEAFAEVRARAACAHELKGIKLDLKAVADLEIHVRTSRTTLEVWLTTNQRLSPLLSVTDSRDPSMVALRDTVLLRVIQTYKSLVTVAPVQHDQPATPQAPVVEEPAIEEPAVEEPEAGGLSSIINGARRLLKGGERRKSQTFASTESGEPGTCEDDTHQKRDIPSSSNAQTQSHGAQIMSLLCAKLTEALSHWADAPETAQHISLKHQALLRLQRWEPDMNGSNGPSGPVSIFDAAIELQKVLNRENSLAASQQIERPIPHDMRLSKTYEEIQLLISKAKTNVDFIDQFDPKGSDPPIDPKPFQMIFSREMDELIQMVGHQLKFSIEALQHDVTNRGQDVETALQTLLASRKNQKADLLLQTWKYLEPLSASGLSAFKHMPGPEAFDKQLQGHASKLAQQAKTAVQMSDKKDGWEKPVTMPLLHLAKFGSDVPRAVNFSNEAMADVLSAAEAKFGAQGMQTLAAELREREPALGNEIISSSDAFVAVTVADFNQKTQRDISVVKKLYADKNKDSPDTVWRKYEEFEKEYNRLLQHCTDGLEHVPDPLAYLVEQAKRYAAKDKGIILNSQDQIPKVLAAIFAWWSIEFLVKLRKRNPHLVADPNKLRRANNGQVVCILRLLGCASYFTELKNHLSEVPTGEGKSVVIGVLATTLALYGFNVDCVCYSSMLSSRDRDDFMQMFVAFGIKDRIRYGTFDTLCEELLTEHYGDLRQATRDFISTGTSTRKVVPNALPRALVIDEVDVFCSEAFFGGAHCPVLTLQNDQIAELMKYIWSCRSSGNDLTAFQQHSSYKAVLKSGVLSEANEWLLERAVREMDKAARAYSSGMHEHIVRGGKILYKIEGRDEYGHWTFDYETNAEYLAEYDSGNLDQDQLNAGLCLYVRCGEFSFAALPGMFQHILGVTGTLDGEKLPPQMHEVLKKEIGIERFTYCPSMYHAQKRDFKPDNPAYVQLAKDVDEHYHLIVDEIDNRLTPTTQMDGQRSVIVFFQSSEDLHTFRDSSYFSKFRDKANVLTELTASRREDRDNIIKSATRQGAVTLASRMYGRGTDFKIFDDRMEKAGGMHVLQTFFSRDLSEEVQIMGRCARQGNKGSYSQVLLSASAAKDFDLTVQSVEAWEPSTVYSNLSQLRADAGSAEVKSLREMAAKRLMEHTILANSLHQFYSANKTSQLGKLMRRYNSLGGMSVGPNGMHVIFCLDESASMSGSSFFQGRSPWDELMDAFNVFWTQSAAEPGPPMYVSVVQFGSGARITQRLVPLQGTVPPLRPEWSGTRFKPAVDLAGQLIQEAGPNHGYTAVVVFMSDGAAGDSAPAAQVLENLSLQFGNQFSSFTVGFGSGAPRTLEQMAFANGVQEKNNYRAASVGNLAEAFSAVAKSIAPGRL